MTGGSTDHGTSGQRPLVQRGGERRRWSPSLDITRPWGLILVIGAGFALGDILGDIASFVVARLRFLLITVLISLFLSFAMEPAVHWMSKERTRADGTTWRPLRRGPSTLLVFFVAIATVVGFFAAMAPLMIEQVAALVEQGPETLEDLSERARELPGGLGEQVSVWLEEASLPDRVNELGERLSRGLLSVGTVVLTRVAQALIVLLVTYYLVADGPRLRRTLLRRLPPDRQERLMTIWDLAIDKTGGYVYLRALVAVASAIFHGVVFTLIGLDYALALGVWVGVVSSLVPVVGTYLAGGLPIVIALASAHPSNALWVAIAVVVYQQLENYLIAPRFSRHTMKVHPAVAFLAVLVGAALLGAVGALLALPTAAIVGALVSAAGEHHEVVSHELVAGPTGPMSVLADDEEFTHPEA